MKLWKVIFLVGVRKFQPMDVDDNLGLISKLGRVSRYFLYQFTTKILAYSSQFILK